jgi:hypothetical protein
MRLIFTSHLAGKISPTHFEDYTSLNNPHKSHSVWVDTVHPIFIDSDLTSVCFIDKDLFLGNCTAAYFTTDIKLVLINITKLAHSTLKKTELDNTEHFLHDQNLITVLILAFNLTSSSYPCLTPF